MEGPLKNKQGRILDLYKRKGMSNQVQTAQDIEQHKRKKVVRCDHD